MGTKEVSLHLSISALRGSRVSTLRSFRLTSQAHVYFPGLNPVRPVTGLVGMIDPRYEWSILSGAQIFKPRQSSF